MAEFKLLLPDGRGIVGSVDEDRVLAFVVLAGEGCPIRGTEMFDLMMRAVSKEIRAIAGVWRTGFGGEPSTNLDRVNELTAAGMPLDDAVRQTWTATRAARWGFSRVTVLGTPAGGVGRYTRIDVLIEKAAES
ncbi:MAG TPA: hypothetical protein VGF55_20355 [Gemmataceae bacterium]|jgi:hypothetical protein